MAFITIPQSVAQGNVNFSFCPAVQNQRYSQNNDVKERRWQICALEQLVPALMYFSLIGYFNRFFLIVKIDSSF